MTPILVFGVALVVFVIWNYLLIQKGGVNHQIQQVVRSVLWAALSVYFVGSGFRSDINNVQLAITYFIAFHLAFWFPFNTALNLIRGVEWNYIGNTAWLDKQMRKWPGIFIPLSFLISIIGIGLLIFPNGY